jgi:hypothetical protein
MMMQANPGTCSPKVKILNQLVITQKTVIALTSGDQSGSLGGVVSATIMGPAQFKNASMKVKVEGSGAAYHTGLVGHNGTNAPSGTHCQPSQKKVFVNG